MHLWLLGTGASEGVPLYGCSCPVCLEAIEKPMYRRKPSSLAVYSDNGEGILVDLGSDVMDKLVDSEITVLAVLLTHWHHDHYAGGLFRFRWTPRKTPLYAPRERYDPEILSNPLSLITRVVEPWMNITIGEFRVAAIPLRHSVETYGYLIRYRDLSVAILHDTKGLPEKTVDFLRRSRVDLAVIDATFAPGVDNPGHNNVDEALEIGEEINAEQIILNHIAHHNLPYKRLTNYVEERTKKAKVALDGMLIEIT